MKSILSLAFIAVLTVLKKADAAASCAADTTAVVMDTVADISGSCVMDSTVEAPAAE
jgi:hypothetical protein